MAVPKEKSQQDRERVPLGQLLVDAGLLDAADLASVLEEQRRSGAPLGRMLVDGGYVASSTIAMALADQHGGLLKTEYGFATGRPAAPTRPEGESGLDASSLPPVADHPAEVSLPPLLLASEPTHGPGERETRRPDLELAPPPAVSVPDLVPPVAAEPVLVAEPTPASEGAESLLRAAAPEPLGRSEADQVVLAKPAMVDDEHALLAGKLAAAELERDALRSRLDEALKARRAAEEAAQANQTSAERLDALHARAEENAPALAAAREELAAARAELAQARAQLEAAQAESADLAASRDELADARAQLETQLAELERAQAERTVDLAAQEAVSALEQEVAAAAAALAEARSELEEARTQIAELEQRSLEQVGGDVAHEALVSLQQENDAAAGALSAARAELAAARAQLSALQTDRNGLEDRVREAELRARELETQVAQRDSCIDDLESRLTAPVSEPGDQPERAYDASQHVLLVPSETGYVTVERPGPAPRPGDIVLLPIGRYQVSRRGSSPFPDDDRGCAYLVQA